MTAALVMAGGQSERMRANGDPRHKALRCVAGLPLIDWNIWALVHFGFSEVYLALNEREPDLIAHAHRCVGVHLLIETTPLGTIGVVSRLPSSVHQVLVVNADNLTDIDLAALLRFHTAEGAAMTIATHEEPFQIPFGRLKCEGVSVLAYEEKPQIKVRVSSGTYVLDRGAIETIHAGERVDIPQLVSRLLAAGHSVRAWTHAAHWIDVNDEKALARAEYLIEQSGMLWPGTRPFREARA